MQHETYRRSMIAPLISNLRNTNALSDLLNFELDETCPVIIGYCGRYICITRLQLGTPVVADGTQNVFQLIRFDQLGEPRLRKVSRHRCIGSTRCQESLIMISD